MKSILKCTFLTLTSYLIALKVDPTRGENILFYWGSSGYSHRISAWPLIEKLVEKGHTITFLSPYPSKDPIPLPNVTDIVPENLAEDVGLFRINGINIRLTQGISAVQDLWYEYYKAGIRGCESILRNPKMIKWINEATFDLVVIDALHNDCAYALVHKFKAKHIMYSPTSAFQWWGDVYGIPEENYPEFQFHFGVDMTFGQSVWNALRPLYWHWKRQSELFPYLEGLFRDKLKMEGMPPLTEMEGRTSLIFANIHFTEEFPRCLPPMFVSIGGIHCNDERKPLAQDVKDFIESGDDGFVYLSFGTYASLSSLPQYLQDIFIGAMAKVKTKFLVKFDGKASSLVLPKNVKLVKWVNQQDILAHPNVKAFIGHGGLLGTQEAVYHGVPMIVLPIFAEQDYNGVRMKSRETGILLEFRELTEEKLLKAISEILTNDKYRNNAKRLSTLFRDRPDKPVDTAVWWVEYVLRHEDLSHVHPIGINRTWYQKRMLDVWGFLGVLILGALIMFVIILSVLIKYLVNIVTGKGHKIQVNGKKSN